MHNETNRFKTYTQLEKTYRKILLPLTRQYSCEWESRNR